MGRKLKYPINSSSLNTFLFPNDLQYILERKNQDQWDQDTNSNSISYSIADSVIGVKKVGIV